MANDPLWRQRELPPIEFTSPDFEHGGQLPQWARMSNMGGENRSPELRWSGVPAEAKSLVLSMYDPDAPTGSGFWHWAVFNLPPETTGLPRGAGDPAAGMLPAGAVMLKNERGLPGYIGAGPPSGHGPHRYFFILTAVDVPGFDLGPDTSPAILGFQANFAGLARGVLMATSETP